MYDIRRPAHDPIVSQSFVDFVNLQTTRAALGVDSIPELAAAAPASFAYAPQSETVYDAFARAGDYVFPSFLDDLDYLLENGIRVLLVHGDADYIGNWFGGEAVSLALTYTQSFLFQATPYTPLSFDDPDSPDYGSGNRKGRAQGKVREYGNLTFAVVYDAGHFLPVDKPALALEMFRRAVTNMDLSTGRDPTNSTAVPFVPDSPLPAVGAETTLPSSPHM
ncbi:hypothetical protein SPBR_07708 [Sporothrix brasiliensis 5110]|uniref:Uncharacterized protein n=1 Tax=Sporothrix brasiliensis 5110 TaxID=1398154 RepID=A0A0C2EQ92_9PEZI|nr:uncharacterized protein SPBR_07708 [Sporothrix brasiliensis 5110]KIH88504.1 hypothetical protein SPBR_07708 [Sporothrix brasiliensis 5110]